MFSGPFSGRSRPYRALGQSPQLSVGGLDRHIIHPSPDLGISLASKILKKFLAERAIGAAAQHGHHVARLSHL
jgi:hypothetical protein